MDVFDYAGSVFQRCCGKVVKKRNLQEKCRLAQASWSPSIPQRVDALNTIVKFSGDMPEMKLTKVQQILQTYIRFNTLPV